MLSPKPWRAEAVIQLVAGVFACLCLGVIATGGAGQRKPHARGMSPELTTAN
jgi:hypothetical protein